MIMKRSILSEKLYRNCELHPSKEAIVCDGVSLSYLEFTNKVSQIANLLYKEGVNHGDHIMVPMNNSIDSVALIFAAMELGACLVPLNPTLPFSAFVSAIDSSDIKHIIARKSFYKDAEKYGNIKVKGKKFCLDSDYEGTISFAEHEYMPTTRVDVNYDIDENDSLILTLTSGSTGNPKPIDISQKNKFDRAMAHIRVYGLTSDERILAATPLYHSLAERLVILPLILGGTSILLPRFTAKLWLQCVDELKPTFTIAVSVQLAQILDLLKQPDAPKIDSFKSIVSSSALLEEKVKLELISLLNCEFHEMYGTSETSTITDICFSKHPDKNKSVGVPFDEADVKILVEDHNDISVSKKPYVVGEIICKTSLLCKGYYKQKKMLQASLYKNYFKTGDLGYLDEDGYLYFSGRKKELIITGAVNVYPHDIDMVVSEMPDIEECAAFSYPDDRLGEVVALAVVYKEDKEADINAIRFYCARHLADFQQPQKIFIVDHLPKNTMGKLQRNMIYDMIEKAEK